MADLHAGDDENVLANVAGHSASGKCSCGANHSWSEVINAAIAALDRKIADLHAGRNPYVVVAPPAPPAEPVVVPVAVPTPTGSVTYTYQQVPAEQDTPGEPEAV